MPSIGINPKAKEREFSSFVNFEREERWARGTDVNITGYGWVCLQGRLEDRDSLAGLSQAADTALRLGLEKTYYFIDRENFLHILTASQVMELFLKGSDFISAIHFDSVVLKAQPDMSVDVQNDAYWTQKTVRPGV